MGVPTAPALARRLADACEAAGIPYAVGGALALGVWGFPRATNDVDLDIFVPPDRLAPVLAGLERAGFGLDRDAAMASARARGDFKLWCDAFDREYVRRWLVDLVGHDDERVARWDEMLRELSR